MRKRLYSETDDAIAPGDSEPSKEESGTSDTFQSIVGNMSEQELARGGRALLPTLDTLNVDPLDSTDAFKTRVFLQFQEEQFEGIIEAYQGRCRRNDQFAAMKESDFVILESLILELQTTASAEEGHEKKIVLLRLMSKVLQSFKFTFGNAKVPVAGLVLKAFHFWQYVEKAATRYEILHSDDTIDGKMVDFARLAANAFQDDSDSDAEPDSDDVELDSGTELASDNDSDDHGEFGNVIYRIERNTEALNRAKEAYPEMQEKMVQRFLYQHGMDLDKMHESVRTQLAYYKDSGEHDDLTQRATFLGVTWRFLALYTMYYENDELEIICAITAYQTANVAVAETLHAKATATVAAPSNREGKQPKN